MCDHRHTQTRVRLPPCRGLPLGRAPWIGALTQTAQGRRTPGKPERRPKAAKRAFVSARGHAVIAAGQTELEVVHSVRRQSKVRRGSECRRAGVERGRPGGRLPSTPARQAARRRAAGSSPHADSAREAGEALRPVRRAGQAQGREGAGPKGCRSVRRGPGGLGRQLPVSRVRGRLGGARSIRSRRVSPAATPQPYPRTGPIGASISSTTGRGPRSADPATRRPPRRPSRTIAPRSFTAAAARAPGRSADRDPEKPRRRAGASRLGAGCRWLAGERQRLRARSWLPPRRVGPWRGGTATRGPCCAAGSGAGSSVAMALLAVVLLIASVARPTRARSRSPGITDPPGPATCCEILFRNSLVLALHAFACVAGFIAGSSLPLSAEQRTGFSRWIHEKAGRSRSPGSSP